MVAKVLILIHWNALILCLKRVKIVPYSGDRLSGNMSDQFAKKFERTIQALDGFFSVQNDKESAVRKPSHSMTDGRKFYVESQKPGANAILLCKE